jgi:hypothetical protein
LFRDEAAPAVPLSRGPIPPITGALALQTGLFAIWVGRPLLAALLMACGAAIWTWSSLSRGAMDRQSEARPSHWLLGILLTVVLTTSLSFVQIQMQLPPEGESSTPPKLLETMQFVWQELENPPPQKPPVRKQRATRVAKTPAKGSKTVATKKEIAGGASGPTLVPGVIVRPELRPQRRLLFVMPGARGRSKAAAVEQVVSIPFTGEYQVFPTSSAHLQHEWAVDHGTLFENAYMTAGGGTLETEAYQPFSQPVDFANCGKIQLVITSEEEGPFAASMQLITGGNAMDLGLEMTGFDRLPEESLEFVVPKAEQPLPVSAVRIAFHRVPKQGTQSMKVVVQRFTLIPR